MKAARTATAAMTTGSSLGSRFTVFLTGMSSENLETALSHSSQLAQFGLRQRFSVAATRCTVSVHSAMIQGVRQDSNPPAARSFRTARASPPRQPMPDTTTEQSKTARGLGTAFLFHPFHDFENCRLRFRFSRPIAIQLLESLQQFRLFFLLPAAN